MTFLSASKVAYKKVPKVVNIRESTFLAHFYFLKWLHSLSLIPPKVPCQYFPEKLARRAPYGGLRPD